MKKRSNREIFNMKRSMYVMLEIGDNLYTKVQICGYDIAHKRIIIAFNDNQGVIKEFNNERAIFDKGYFDGKEAQSYDLVDADKLTFIDTNVKYYD